MIAKNKKLTIIAVICIVLAIGVACCIWALQANNAVNNNTDTGIEKPLALPVSNLQAETNTQSGVEENVNQDTNIQPYPHIEDNLKSGDVAGSNIVPASDEESQNYSYTPVYAYSGPDDDDTFNYAAKLANAFKTNMQISNENEVYYKVATEDGKVTLHLSHEKKDDGYSENTQTTGASPSWHKQIPSIKRVVIDNEIKPVVTRSWFSPQEESGEYDSPSITSFSGLNNLKMDATIDASYMFAGIGFRGEKVTVSDPFVTLNLAELVYAEGMFNNTDFFNCGFGTYDVSITTSDKLKFTNYMFQKCHSLKWDSGNTLDMTGVMNAAYMFNESAISGELSLNNLIKNGVTVRSIFNSCANLEKINLSGSEILTENDDAILTNMFRNCSNLTTITVSSGTDWTNVGFKADYYKKNIFLDCTKLAGGIDTKYTSDHTDNSYAKIDGGEGNPGYFTEAKETKAWADIQENNDGKTYSVTLYYNNEWQDETSFLPENLETDDDVITLPWVLNGEGKFRSVTSFTIDESMKDYEIPGVYGLFALLPQVVELDVSNLNTSAVKSMVCMFGGIGEDFSAVALQTITFGGSFNTSSVTDMSGMFYGCEGLTTLDLSNLNTSSVTYMSHMFDDCSSLKDLDLSSFNTSGVTDMSGMFSSCKALNSLTFGGSFNTSGVTDMYGMFNLCSSLTTLDLSNFDTSSVMDMSYMFYGCTLIESFTFPETFATSSNGCDMSHMFDDCSSLKDLDLSSFNTSGVTYMSYMFDNCSSLDTLIFGYGWHEKGLSNDCGLTGTWYGPDGIAYDNISEMSKRIKKLSEDETITFTKTAPEKTLKVVYDTSDSPTTNESKNSLSFYYDTNDYRGEGITVWENNKDKTEIPLDARDVSQWRYHDNRTDIKEVYIDSSMSEFSEFKSLFGIFYNCQKLTTLNVSNFNTSNVTNMSNMFAYSTKLTTLDLSNLNTSSVTDMSSMFNNCQKLTTLDLSNLNTSKVENMINMFNKCDELDTLTFGYGWHEKGLSENCGLTGTWYDPDGKSYTPESDITEMSNKIKNVPEGETIEFTKTPPITWIPMQAEAYAEVNPIDFYPAFSSTNQITGYKFATYDGTYHEIENIASMSDIYNALRYPSSGDPTTTLYYQKTSSDAPTLKCYKVMDMSWNYVFGSSSSIYEPDDYSDDFKANYQHDKARNVNGIKTALLKSDDFGSGWNVDSTESTSIPLVNTVEYANSSKTGFYDCYGGCDGGLLSDASNYPWGCRGVEYNNRAFYFDVINGKWNRMMRYNDNGVVLARAFN